MFEIGELSERSGVSSKTIRYYEEIGLLPPARRGENGYRLYDESDIARLQFVRNARALDFALDDIKEILAFKERDEPPCGYVLNLMEEQIHTISERIRQLEVLRAELARLYEIGRNLPEDAQMRSCVCHLISTPQTDQ